MIAPETWEPAYAAARRHDNPPCVASATVTTGFTCAPEIDPKATIREKSAAPVATLLASSAMAPFPPARRTPMMPEPTIAPSSIAVATNSATAANPL